MAEFFNSLLDKEYSIGFKAEFRYPSTNKWVPIKAFRRHGWECVSSTYSDVIKNGHQHASTHPAKHVTVLKLRHDRDVMVLLTSEVLVLWWRVMTRSRALIFLVCTLRKRKRCSVSHKKESLVTEMAARRGYKFKKQGEQLLFLEKETLKQTILK